MVFVWVRMSVPLIVLVRDLVSVKGGVPVATANPVVSVVLSTKVRVKVLVEGTVDVDIERNEEQYSAPDSLPSALSMH